MNDLSQNEIYDALNEMRDAIDAAQTEAEKFVEKGNGAASTRLRKAMQSVKGLAQGVRVSVSTQKNNK